MSAVLWVFAAIGLWFTVSVALLLIWIAANERAGRRQPKSVTSWTGEQVRTVVPRTTSVEDAQRREKFARQLGRWR